MIVATIPDHTTVHEACPRLRLSKVLMIPDHMTMHEPCRRMASHMVDVVLLPDSSNAFSLW